MFGRLLQRLRDAGTGKNPPNPPVCVRAPVCLCVRAYADHIMQQGERGIRAVDRGCRQRTRDCFCASLTGYDEMRLEGPGLRQIGPSLIEIAVLRHDLDSYIPYIHTNIHTCIHAYVHQCLYAYQTDRHADIHTSRYTTGEARRKCYLRGGPSSGTRRRASRHSQQPEARLPRHLYPSAPRRRPRTRRHRSR